MHTLIDYDKTKFVLIPNGFDTEFFKPNLMKILLEKYSITPKEFIFGTVGRYDLQDYPNLIKQFQYSKINFKTSKLF